LKASYISSGGFLDIHHLGKAIVKVEVIDTKNTVPNSARLFAHLAKFRDSILLVEGICEQGQEHHCTSTKLQFL